MNMNAPTTPATEANVVETRVAKIERLTARIRFMAKEATQAEGHLHFTALFAEIFDVLRLDNDDLAKEFSVNEATIGRWRRGISIPSASVRSIIYVALGRRLAQASKDPAALVEPPPDEDRHAVMARLAESVRSMLTSAPKVQRQEQFSEILAQAMRMLGLSDTDVAVEISTSRSSVNGWRLGKRTPAEAVRTVTYEFLKRSLAKAIKDETP